MCGIVYKKSFNGQPVNQAIVQMYKHQRSRGTEGFGFFLPEQDRLAHNTKEQRILKLLQDQRYQATEVMFHHRFPTSTDNVQNSCHPFSTRANKHVFDHNYVLVHNGVVTNASTLKIKHEALGISYVSEGHDGRFNDSEALLYDVALYLEGKQDKLEAAGSIAFICKREDGKTYFARNYGSPLVYELTSRGLTIRSEGTGQQVVTNKLYEFLEDQRSFILTPLVIAGWGGTTTTSGSTSQGYTYDYDDYDEYNDAWIDRVWPDEAAEVVPFQTNVCQQTIDFADSFGGVDQAIEWLEDRIESHKETIAFAHEQYRDDPDSNNELTGVIDTLNAELFGYEALMDDLWDLWMDETAEVYRRRDMERNYATK